MNLDFFEQFKNYSNTELLRIVKRPSDYQAAAVIAAEEILKGRQVGVEEIQLVDQYFFGLDSSLKAKNEKADALKSKATDFFDPVLNPGEKLEPNKWVNVFLLAIAVHFSWTVFNTIKWLVGFLQCDYCSFH